MVNHGARFQGEMDRFGALLKESYEALRCLEEKKLVVEEQKMATEERMRAEDREEHNERAEEWESRERVEMKKCKLMLEMIKDIRK